MTLTEFLLARIAEDEGRASDALSVEPHYLHFGDTAADALLGLAESEGADTSALLHFGRHRPARVLAECEAKRRIIEHVQPQYGDCTEGCNMSRILNVMAAVYADHPDYREEWRP